MMAAITSIYTEYRIMPQLQQHQLRVAAVAKQICDNFPSPLDEPSVLSACLLHDMGNILKFELDRFPEFNEPEGLEYWETVKREMGQKYNSTDEHEATVSIAKELGASQKVIGYIDAIGFDRAADNVTTSSFEAKICCYADQRVGPYGVLPLNERLADGKKRYEGREEFAYGNDRHEEYSAALREIERQIFSETSIQPEDITDASTGVHIADLKHYNIAT